MTLMDELLAPRAYTCKLCRWLETLSPAQQAEWDEALRNPKVMTRSALRSARKRGYDGTGHEAVANHRLNGHRAKR